MIVAVVPFKSGAHAKSRLTGAMGPEQRSRLSFQMLHHVLSVLAPVPRIGEVAVVTAGEVDGTTTIPDPGHGLNAAVGAGVRWAQALRATAVLVLPADLPFLSGGDVEAMLRYLTPEPGISTGAVAMSKDGGTGGLLLRPPDLIQPAFGPASGDRHIRLVREAGVAPAKVRRSGLAIDIDVPGDLDLLGDDLLDIVWGGDGHDRRVGIDGTNQTREHLSRTDFEE
ncbi:MAG TPA: 2-phospho-L-lactate guanylyltransferase [Chloroflexota bacterium]|jgi:2-phospho-L-lactate guanylyltransferase|nr:2-phospho-L-lactate guanylyltransferase [Chloroflexota bacterium]